MRKRHQPAEPEGTWELGEECEAFLAGRWVDYCAAQGQEAPGWAWLNAVAHGSEESLRRMTRTPTWGNRDVDDWNRLRSCVAEAVLYEATMRGPGIAELQLAVLVPIELRLFADRVPKLGNAELLIRILAALRHPSARSGSR